VGDQAPDFVLKDQNSQDVQLSHVKRKAVLSLSDVFH